jgi:hypothetical protein
VADAVDSKEEKSSSTESSKHGTSWNEDAFALSHAVSIWKSNQHGSTTFIVEYYHRRAAKLRLMMSIKLFIGETEFAE